MLEVRCHTAKCKHTYSPLLLPLLTMALPLMANRLTLSFLQSLEAIFVPNQLLLSETAGSRTTARELVMADGKRTKGSAMPVRTP